MSKFTIGCDPEFFLRVRKSGKLISAIPHVTGTKHDPMTLPKGGNIQRDNVAVEVATDPANSMQAFVDNIMSTLSEAVKTLPQDTEIVAVASAKFDEKELEHPDAKVFGCDPDYCAYELIQNEAPYVDDVTFRSCGAHIHVGTTGEDENAFLLEFEGKINVIKVMDCLHGVISAVLDATPESIDRRKLYGKPGSHRPKDYGVEYRVLSNYWLKSPVTVMLMYHLTKDALDIVRNNKADDLYDTLGLAEVRRVIMEGDSIKAMEMIENTILGLISQDSGHYFNEALAKVRANDMDFHNEWKLYKEIA